MRKISKDLIIDFHAHLTDYENFQESAYDWFLRPFDSLEEYKKFSAFYTDPDNFVKLLKENGVDYAVILAEYAPLTTGIITNEKVKKFCQGKEELIPFCSLNPYLIGDLGKNLEELCQNHGFKGIKLYPTYNYFYPNDHKLYPIYEMAQSLDIPVLFHTGSSIFKNSRIKYGNPLFFDDVAVDFPQLKIVMAHGGRGVWYDEALLMVRLHKNVYIDITGLPPQKLLTYYPDIERFSHKFIFGSDWPGVVIKQNIELIKDLPISEETKKQILGTNAARILKLL